MFHYFYFILRYNNYTQYGHADFFDPWIRKSIVCKSCETNCDYDLYTNSLAKTISLFVLALREKDPKYLNAIENPKASGMFDPKINIISEYKLNNYDVLKTGPFCNHL
jgi:hypothetical protein